MAETVEAILLRENWNREFLERYQNQWIAIRRKEIIAYGEQLEQVMKRADPADQNLPKPLYAFAYLGRLQ